ncbi:MAG: tetratricopeptide repeat protein, partial [Pseudomonadota bacterium]
MIRHFALGYLLAVGFALPVQAQDRPVPTVAQIEAAFAAGDLAAARAGLAQRVTGDPSLLTQFRYGRMLVEGMGGPADAAEGMAWLQRAADAGHLPARTLMARVLLTQGPSRDPEQAVRWLRDAAARGDLEAKFLLSLQLLAGDGVARDPQTAFVWMRAAAQEGYAQAMPLLSRFHADGTGTPADPAAARMWLERAAEAGVPDALFAVATAQQQQGAAAQDFAALYTRAAEAGHVPSQRALGTLLMTGAPGLERDGEQAELWLSRAASAGDVPAMHNLGLGYLAGDVLAQDASAAADLFERASDAGLARSTFMLGRMVASGKGRPADPVKAQRILALAAEQGSEPAAQHLGQQVLNDTLATPVAPHVAVPWVMALVRAGDAPQARDWIGAQADAGVRPAQAALGAWLLGSSAGDRARALLTAAGTAGHVPSQFRLGRALATGVGMPVDYVAAHTWLNIAAGSGHAEAAQVRDTITALMTPDQIAAAQDAARAYFEAPPPVPQVQE